MTSDEQLVALAQAGDRPSQDELLWRYKKTVLSIARRFFLSGGETDDLVQEGMCGLYAAIGSYVAGKSSFSTYAHTCIRNRIVDAVKASRNEKNVALSDFLPIVEVGEELYFSCVTPEDELIKRENRREFLQKISGILSALEFQVIVMYMDGLSVSEISSSLHRPQKAVDNALQRGKRKLQVLFRE